MMMPDSKPKYFHLSIVLSSMLVLSGCSVPSFLKMDAIGDTVDYHRAANPVRALAIPPGLSDPDFDSTYASVQSGSGNAGTVAVASSVGMTEAQSTSAVVSSSGGSSLGAALMAQSEVDGQGQTAQEVIPDTAIQAPAARTVVMPQVTMIRLKGGEPALAINAPYASAWKLLAPVLSDVGFSVGKQQPNQGIITTTFKGQGKNLRNGQGYLILLAENASKQSFIGVADANGKPESEAVAQEVLELVKAAFEK